jgi:hypothetical protein
MPLVTWGLGGPLPFGSVEIINLTFNFNFKASGKPDFGN